MQLFIAQAIAECGVSITVHKDYAYRNGFGKTTAAVSADGMNEFMKGVLAYCRWLTLNDPNDRWGFYADLLKMMDDLKMDNMGKGYIYY